MMQNALRRKLHEKQGLDVCIYGVAMICICFLFAVLVSEFFRMQIISTGVRDAVEQAVTSVAISNAYNSYNGVREGNSGAYQLSGEDTDDWRENISTIDVQNKLVSLLHLKSKSGAFIHPNPEGESYEYKISELNVIPDNAEFASNGKKAKYMATCRVEIPFSMGFESFPPAVIHMRHQSVYVALFD